MAKRRTAKTPGAKTTAAKTSVAKTPRTQPANTTATSPAATPSPPPAAAASAGTGSWVFLEASAGTGKTEKIQGILIERVLDQSMTVEGALERTLLVSFTDAAAAELRTRIQGTLAHVIQVLESKGTFRSSVLEDAVNAAAGHPADKVTRLTAAQAAIDKLEVGTIHSFCKQLINRFPIECGARTGLVIVSDLADIGQEATADAFAELVALYSSHGLWQQGFEQGRGFPGNTLNPDTPDRLQKLATGVIDCDLPLEPPQQPSLLNGGQLSQDYGTIRDWFAHQIRNRIEVRKQQLGLLSLSDLVQTVDVALAKTSSPLGKAVAAQWDLIILDEAQDTDAAQWRILQHLAGSTGRFIAVGDPKQSIFSFRGAHYHSLPPLQAGSPWQIDRTTLATNYRSDAPLLHSLNTFFGNGAIPQFTPVTPKHGCRLHTGPVAAATAASALHFDLARPAGPGSFEIRQCFDAVAEAIRRELEAGLQIFEPDEGHDGRGRQRPVGPGDVAVLVHSNRSADAMRQALIARGIPVAAASRASVLESDELRELAAVFAAIAAPFDHKRVTAAAMTSIIGFDNVAVNQMLRDGDASTDRQALVARLATLRQTLMLEGLGPVLEMIFDDPWPPSGVSARERILREPDGERAMKNLLDIAAVLIQEFWRPRDSAPSEAISQWLLNASARDSARELVEDDTQGFGVALETDSDAVRIMTVHAAKGRQFGIVWLPEVCRSFNGNGLSFNNYGQPWKTVHRGEVVLEPSADPGQAKPQAIVERVEEELRSLYVAATRGHHRTHVVVGCFDLADNRKSPRLPIGHLLVARPPANLNTAPAACCGRGRETQLLAELQRIQSAAQQHGGVVVIEDLPTPTSQRLAVQAVPQAVDPTAPLTVPAAMRLSSFTSLKKLAAFSDSPAVRGAAGAIDHASAAGPVGGMPDAGRFDDEADLHYFDDSDEPDETGVFGGVGELDGGGEPGQLEERGEGSKAAVPLPASRTPLVIPLSILPGSRKSGDFVHLVLDRIVPIPEELTEDDIAGVIAAVAGEQGYPADSPVRSGLAGPLRAALSQSLGGPVFGELSLLDLAHHGQARAEVPFMAALDLESEKCKADLHAVFAANGRGDFEGFADTLKPLKAAEARGLLTGKIDLVWRCQKSGKVALIDYKTNTLRLANIECLEAYSRDGIAKEMTASRYLLQAALYAAVTDSWLQAVDPAWDYDARFAGVSFPFLRAMGPHNKGTPGVGDQSDNAVFHVAVPRELARGLASALKIGVRGGLAASAPGATS
jgi:exodeoxyribonuclease V beta subunit